MKFLKYIGMAMLLMSAFALTSVSAYAAEEVAEVEEACAEAEASISALPLAAAAFIGVPSAVALGRRRRRNKR